MVGDSRLISYVIVSMILMQFETLVLVPLGDDQGLEEHLERTRTCSIYSGSRGLLLKMTQVYLGRAHQYSILAIHRMSMFSLSQQSMS